MAYSLSGNVIDDVPVPSGVNLGYDLPDLSFLDDLEEDLGQHTVHTVPEPSPEPHVDEMDFRSIIDIPDSKPPVDVEFAYKVEKAGVWKPLTVPVPIIYLGDPGAIIKHLRDSPLLSEKHPVLRWAADHKDFTMSTRNPKGPKSRPEKLPSSVCWPQTDTQKIVWPFDDKNPPADELYLFVNCPECVENRFALPQAIEKVTRETIASTVPVDDPRRRRWQCADCASSAKKKEATASKKRKCESPGRTPDSPSMDSPGWTRDPDYPEKIRTSSDVQIDRHLKVAGDITGRFVNTSDARLKENIVAHTPEDDDASRAAITSLPTCKYSWKQGTDSAGQHVPCGVLAQDVERRIGPDAVGLIGEAEVDGELIADLKGVRQDAMMPRLIGAVKSLDRDVRQNTAATTQLAADIENNATAATEVIAEQAAEINELRSDATAAVEAIAEAFAEQAAEISKLYSMFEELHARLGHLNQTGTALPRSTLEQLKHELRSTNTAIVRDAGPAIWLSYTGPEYFEADLDLELDMPPSLPGTTACPRAPSWPDITPASDGGNAEPSHITSLDASPAPVVATQPVAMLPPTPRRSAPFSERSAIDHQGSTDRASSPTHTVGAAVMGGEEDKRGTPPPKLREYQRHILDGVLAWLDAEPHRANAPDVAAVVLPTGAGKTSIAFALLLASAKRHPGHEAVFLAPKIALVEQQAERFRRRSDVIDDRINVRVLAGGTDTGSTVGVQVIFATPEMYLKHVKGRSDILLSPHGVAASILILDESHHANATTNHPYRFALDKAGPGAKVVGLSATPGAFLDRNPKVFTVKAGERGLPENRVEEVHLTVTTRCLSAVILRDHLLQLKDFSKAAQRRGDQQGVRLEAKTRRIYRNVGWDQAQKLIISERGDPQMFELANPVRQSPIIDAVATILRKAKGRPTDRDPQVILYCDHKESARRLKHELDRMSKTERVLRWIRAGLMLGSASSGSGQSKTASNQALEDFREMNVNVLVATSCIREGIDVPDCNVVIAVEPPLTKDDSEQLKGRARSCLEAQYFVICLDNDECSDFDKMVNQPDRVPLKAATVTVAEEGCDVLGVDTGNVAAVHTDNGAVHPGDGGPDGAVVHDVAALHRGVSSSAFIHLAAPPARPSAPSPSDEKGPRQSPQRSPSRKQEADADMDLALALSLSEVEHRQSPGTAVTGRRPARPQASRPCVSTGIDGAAGPRRPTPAAPSATMRWGDQRPRRKQEADSELDLALALSLSQSEHRPPSTATSPSFPTGVVAEAAASDKAGAWETKDRILRALAAAQRPLTALELSKAVGLTTAKDVNTHVYALAKEGRVATLSKAGSKPCWSLVGTVSVQQHNLENNVVAMAMPTDQTPRNVRAVLRPARAQASPPYTSKGADGAAGPRQSTPLQPPRQVHDPSANAPLPARILGALATAQRPLTALELSKAAGLTTAKDVNTHIYALERERKVETLSKAGSKPCWSLV